MLDLSSATLQLRLYEAKLKSEFPNLRMVRKDDDALSRLIDRALRLLTLGAQKSYLTHYVTTIGSVIYLPTGWESRSAADRIVVLRHEAVHLRQFRRFGLMGMAVLYLLVPLPMGLSFVRARLEWEAYAETLCATYELFGREALLRAALHDHIVEQFVSGAYGWMWPFRSTIRRWVKQEVARILETSI